MHAILILGLYLHALGIGGSWFGAADVQDVTVSSSAELAAALGTEGNVVIRLASGDYTDIEIRDRHAGTTIVSADAANRAVVNGWVWVNASSNVTIERVDIDPTSVASFDDWHPALSVTDSTDVQLRELLIDGHIVEPGEGLDPATIMPGDPNPGAIVGYAFGNAMWIRYSSRVTVDSVEIRNFRVGAFLQNSEQLALSNLWVHSMRSEGLNLEDLREVTIENSQFEGFHPWLNSSPTDSDHPDMIQFWGINGEWGIEDLTIANNVFLQTDGGWTQSVFGSLAGGDPQSVTFRGFKIHDNLIINNHLHGITLGNVSDSEIHHNLLLPGPGWLDSNSTRGIPMIFLPDEIPQPTGNSVHGNIVVAPPGQMGLDEYFGASADRNEIGSNTYLGDEVGSAYFLDVFPNVHEPYSGVPDLTTAMSGEIGEPHGPRWLPAGRPSPFSDSYDSEFLDDIVWLEDSGVTQGCTPTQFCPDEPVTRGQMAAFFTRAFDLPEAAAAGFSDTADSVFAQDIDRIAAAGITDGCTPSRFCPDEAITRGQMAAFFNRALDLPPGAPSGFTDVGSSVFIDDIERMAASGITTGCASRLFCPHDSVTRGQMAAFFHRASATAGWPS